MTTWKRLKWSLADWLSYAACKLRGNEWYEHDNFAGVPGNRAADLEQSIWEDCVVALHDRPEDLKEIEPKLRELANIAGAQFGHVWPAGSPGYRKHFRPTAENQPQNPAESAAESRVTVQAES